MTKTAIILSGPPGCGKTTWARKQRDFVHKQGRTCDILSTDDYWTRDGGKYEDNFDPAKLGQAHAWNLCHFIESLHHSNHVTIVDNTNIHEWEYRHYLLAARLAGCHTSVHQWLPERLHDVRQCVTRNTHGVPRDVVLRMAFEMEACDPANCDEVVFHRVNE